MTVSNAFFQYSTNDTTLIDPVYQSNFTKLSNFSQFKTFAGDANVIKLYDTEPWRIGIDSMPSVNLNTESRNFTFVKKNSTVVIFGIPV